MRVLVRDDVNRLYWSGGDRWVAEVAAASEFQTLQQAAQKALEQRARDLSVILAYDQPVCELALNPDFCVEPTARRAAAA